MNTNITRIRRLQKMDGDVGFDIYRLGDITVMGRTLTAEIEVLADDEWDVEVALFTQGEDTQDARELIQPETLEALRAAFAEIDVHVSVERMRWRGKGSNSDTSIALNVDIRTMETA